MSKEKNLEAKDIKVTSLLEPRYRKGITDVSLSKRNEYCPSSGNF